jgi:hypothetical protein
MKIYKDILSGDEVLSDIYPMKEVDDVVYEVEGKRITVTENQDFDIGANPSTEGGEEEGTLGPETISVINVVHAHRLVETSFDKKSYMAYIKTYMKKILDHLKQKNPSRVETFQKNVQPFVKKILERFNDFQFYTGPTMDPEALVVLMFYKEDGITPAFYFFKDGLEEEKV